MRHGRDNLSEKNKKERVRGTMVLYKSHVLLGPSMTTMKDPWFTGDTSFTFITVLE